MEDGTYTNPVIAWNSPDPGVLRLPGEQGYVAVTTSNFALKRRGDPAFPLYHSWDLVVWRAMGHVFPAGQWPAWAEENMWAPDIQLVDGRYTVYFTGAEWGSDYCPGGNTLLWAIHRTLGPHRSISWSKFYRLCHRFSTATFDAVFPC